MFIYINIKIKSTFLIYCNKLKFLWQFYIKNFFILIKREGTFYRMVRIEAQNIKSQDRSSGNILFPQHTNFVNNQTSMFLYNVNSNETAPADLYDNMTGMLNLDESVWESALLEQDRISCGNDNFKTYIDFEENDSHRTYKYDSNQDGSFETVVKYSNAGAIWAMVRDEYNSDINCVQIEPTINNVYIGYDNGDYYSEFSDHTGTFENGEFNANLEYNNVIVKRQTEKRLYKISFNEDGSAKNTTLRQQER